MMMLEAKNTVYICLNVPEKSSINLEWKKTEKFPAQIVNRIQQAQTQLLQMGMSVNEDGKLFQCLQLRFFSFGRFVTRFLVDSSFSN